MFSTFPNFSQRRWNKIVHLICCCFPGADLILDFVNPLGPKKPWEVTIWSKKLCHFLGAQIRCFSSSSSNITIFCRLGQIFLHFSEHSSYFDEQINEIPGVMSILAIRSLFKGRSLNFIKQLNLGLLSNHLEGLQQRQHNKTGLCMKVACQIASNGGAPRAITH